MSEVAIRVSGVYKDFQLPHERNNTIKSALLNSLRGKRSRTVSTQHALKNVSFDIHTGEFFGIVGRNGSGKSTLLKILAGIYQPTKGSIDVVGKLVPFIELGVGFNPELTGRDNVFLNGSLLGFTVNEVEKMYDDIVRFAELEEFMDQKLKNYSSGMQVRLAFSMAIRADADILLVDEVLAVGDADFQRKCFEYFKSLKKNNKTVVFVSHSMDAVREYCDKAVLIDHNEVVFAGSSDEVATKYTKLFMGKESDQSVLATGGEKRWGDKAAIYTNATVKGMATKQLTIELEAKAAQDIDQPIFGFLIREASGKALLGTNTKIRKQKIDRIKEGEKVAISWSFPNVLNDGTYYVEPSIIYPNTEVCDWWEEAATFTVKKAERTPYPINPEVSVNYRSV